MTNVLRFSPSKLDRIFNEHRLRGFRKEELRVTSPQNEPFLSGETNDKQARAQWFTQQFNRFYPFGTCRVRGLHYRCVAVGDLLKPNGKVYQNTEDDWCWLGLAATNARWLGLVPFDRIVDNRNDDPIIIQRPPIPELCCRTRPSLLNVGFDSEVDIAVDPEIEGFEPHQPYTLAIYGEKSSLKDICLSLCERFDADLYLPAGEFSVTQAYGLARRAVADGRPVVLLTLTDSDPQGHNMPTAVARKLQAFKCSIFPRLEYRVIPIALTPRQADELDLPSTPLKGKNGLNKRALKWRETFGRDQTEIDAMIALYPDLLHDMIVDAVEPFYDETLGDRVRKAREEYEERAREWIDQQVGHKIDALRGEADRWLGPYFSTIIGLQKRIDDIAGEVTLPDTGEIPQAELPDAPSVYVDSRWTWKQQTDAMRARKAFEVDDDEDEAA